MADILSKGGKRLVLAGALLVFAFAMIFFIARFLGRIGACWACGF